MKFYNCSTCSETVTEKHLQAVTAVRVAEKVYCFGCVTTRVAKVSDSTIMRALLAGGSGHSMLRPVRRISQRLIASMPTGKFRRIARRVSERLLGTQTGYYLPMERRVPRRQLPAASVATIASISRARRDSQHVAIASVACVGLAIVTLMAYLAFSSKNEPASTPATKSAEATMSTPTLAATPVQTAPIAVPHATREMPARVRLEAKDVAAPVVLTAKDPAATRAPVALAGLDTQNDSTPAIPPLLTERGDAPISSAPSRMQPESSRAIAAVSAPVANTEPTEFAPWEVENLDKNAMAKAHASFDGYAFVLETRPPDAAKELRVLWKLTVPADKPIVEFLARTDAGCAVAMCLDLNGKRTAPLTLKGADWRVFSLDLSALRGQPVTLVLNHIPTGKAGVSGYWQTPQFFALAASDATMLMLDQSAVSAPVAPVVSAAPAAAASASPRLSGTHDMRIEYEKMLGDFYRTLATQGVPAAKGFLVAAKSSPELAPMRSNIERDERSLDQIEELRQAAMRCARELKPGESIKLISRDGKEYVVGAANIAVKDVDSKGVTFEQTIEKNTALMMLKWDEMTMQTRQELAALAIGRNEADLDAAMAKLVVLSRTGNTQLAREIGVALKNAAKIPALADRAENMQRHLDFFERETTAAKDYKSIEALMMASQWRDARTKIEQFQTAYANSYALDRVSPTLEQWTAEIQKQSVSPLLKR